MNNGATAADVALDCSGVYVETDYRSDLSGPSADAVKLRWFGP